MKIRPVGNRIQLEIEEPKAGELSLSSLPTAVEYGTVIAIGPMVATLIGQDPIKKGDKVFFKAWAVDIINYEGKKYHFIAQDTNGICAVVTDK